MSGKEILYLIEHSGGPQQRYDYSDGGEPDGPAHDYGTWEPVRGHVYADGSVYESDLDESGFPVFRDRENRSGTVVRYIDMKYRGNVNDDPSLIHGIRKRHPGMSYRPAKFRDPERTEQNRVLCESFGLTG